MNNLIKNMSDKELLELKKFINEKLRRNRNDSKSKKGLKKSIITSEKFGKWCDIISRI